jgi:hypothetical protein
MSTPSPRRQGWAGGGHRHGLFGTSAWRIVTSSSSEGASFWLASKKPSSTCTAIQPALVGAQRQLGVAAGGDAAVHARQHAEALGLGLQPRLETRFERGAAGHGEAALAAAQREAFDARVVAFQPRVDLAAADIHAGQQVAHRQAVAGDFAVVARLADRCR